ncbi:MAG: 50S ribosomal protein L32 [Planctomycetota bacterium]
MMMRPPASRRLTGRARRTYCCRPKFHTQVGLCLGFATQTALPGATTVLPAQRQSYGRTRRRRTHDALTMVKPGICPVSGMPKRHHRVCSESGYVRAGLTIRVPKLGIGNKG